MRALGFLVVLTALMSGCCCPSPYVSARSPVLADPTWAGIDSACRSTSSFGYRRPCYTPYRPIDSAALP